MEWDRVARRTSGASTSEVGANSALAETHVTPGVRRRHLFVKRRTGKTVRWRSMLAVTGVVFCTAILLLSSTLQSVPFSNSNARTSGSSSTVGNESMTFPYLVNASLYPTPDQLATLGSNVTLPQLAVTTYGALAPVVGLGLGPALSPTSLNPTLNPGLGSTYLYEMVYSQTYSTGSTLFQFSSASLNTTAAGSILNNPTCGCSPHLPLTWGENLTVAAYPHGDSITADAIAASGSVVVAAATVSGQTHSWFSEDYGHNGSWVSLSVLGAAPGGSPRLAVQGCTALLTTISTGKLVVTTLKLPCESTVNTVTPGTQLTVNATGGIPPPGPPSPPPNVSSVSPSSGYVGTPVTIQGANFASGAVAFFGGTPALTFFVSSIELQAIVPSKISSKTTFNVTVQVNGLVSTYNPPHDDFTFLPSVVAVHCQDI
jgi:hypothetical protein